MRRGRRAGRWRWSSSPAPLLMAAAVPMADCVTSTGFVLSEAGVLVQIDDAERGDRGAERRLDRVRSAGDVRGVEDLRAPAVPPSDARGGGGVGVVPGIGQRDRARVVPEHVDRDQVSGGVRAVERQRVRRATRDLLRSSPCTNAGVAACATDGDTMPSVVAPRRTATPSATLRVVRVTLAFTGHPPVRLSTHEPTNRKAAPSARGQTRITGGARETVSGRVSAASWQLSSGTITMARRRQRPEQVVRKLREFTREFLADVMASSIDVGRDRRRTRADRGQRGNDAGVHERVGVDAASCRPGRRDRPERGLARRDSNGIEQCAARRLRISSPRKIAHRTGSPARAIRTHAPRRCAATFIQVLSAWSSIAIQPEETATSHSHG